MTQWCGRYGTTGTGRLPLGYNGAGRQEAG